jgi:RNA polymerase sigma-70 factor (ECF subfamily)
VAIDDFADVLAAEETTPMPARDVGRQLAALPDRQHEVVRAISLEGASIRDTALRLNISEGAVRVALHRGLAALAANLRKPEK